MCYVTQCWRAVLTYSESSSRYPGRTLTIDDCLRACYTTTTATATVPQNVVTDARNTGLAQLMARNADPQGAFNGSLAYPNGTRCLKVLLAVLLTVLLTVLLDGYRIRLRNSQLYAIA
jgi:hypothetical protein